MWSISQGMREHCVTRLLYRKVIEMTNMTRYSLGDLVVNSMCPDGKSEQCMHDKIQESVY